MECQNIIDKVELELLDVGSRPFAPQELGPGTKQIFYANNFFKTMSQTPFHNDKTPNPPPETSAG